MHRGHKHTAGISLSLSSRSHLQCLSKINAHKLPYASLHSDSDEDTVMSKGIIKCCQWASVLFFTVLDPRSTWFSCTLLEGTQSTPFYHCSSCLHHPMHNGYKGLEALELNCKGKKKKNNTKMHSSLITIQLKAQQSITRVHTPVIGSCPINSYLQ